MPGKSYPRIKIQNGEQLENLPAVMGGLKDCLDNFDITQQKEEALLSCGMAAAYGNLAECADKLPSNTLIAVAGVLREFAKMTQVKFSNVLSSLMAYPLLRSELENVDIRTESLEKSGPALLMMKQKDGNPTPELITEVENWLKSVMKDDYVINDLNIDTKLLSKIMAMATSKIDKKNIKYGDAPVFYKKDIIDIGVVRMPGREQQEILLYSLQINMSVNCFRTSEISYEEKVSLNGTYQWRRFMPRDSMIDLLKEDTRNQAVEEGKKFYGKN